MSVEISRCKLQGAYRCCQKLLPSSLYGSMKDYEILRPKWIPLLATQHPIFQSKRVPQIWQFAHNLRVLLGGHGTMWTMRSYYVLSKAPLTFTIHLRRIMKYFSSNGYLSWQDIIIFPLLRGYPKSDMLMQFESSPWWEWHGVSH